VHSLGGFSNRSAHLLEEDEFNLKKRRRFEEDPSWEDLCRARAPFLTHSWRVFFLLFYWELGTISPEGGCTI
jgi:hypothetical protein